MRIICGGSLIRYFGVFVFLVGVVNSEEKCSRTCIAQNCKSLTIRYGKYCGIGYFGCADEQPCDDLDVCCMIHDNCVGVKGMTYINCHKQFQRCVSRLNNIVKESKNQKVGFSKQCPYSRVIPTVHKGMDYGIFFSRIGNIFKPSASNNGSDVEVDLAKTKVDTKDGLGTKQGLKVDYNPKMDSKATVSLDVLEIHTVEF